MATDFPPLSVCGCETSIIVSDISPEPESETEAFTAPQLGRSSDSSSSTTADTTAGPGLAAGVAIFAVATVVMVGGVMVSRRRAARGDATTISDDAWIEDSFTDSAFGWSLQDESTLDAVASAAASP
eukprot:CAMPEP_0206320524 /NCGR_PEP_ID=MMETSP0106_2-20121207/18373_1 /ASSEMBLY_ACC=CAM_ASM_000206 /TAXON_ID=81532 /ORGANISM="Acanthoeca-like sp., Strain 10tr" /LENGTH=126 /DNA_ID=CAMNT_0053752505 /DNA_START=43 /DNA_END=419 /DNA_ORIENTATION=+